MVPNLKEPSYLDFYIKKPKLSKWRRDIPEPWDYKMTKWKGNIGREVPVYVFVNKDTGETKGISGWQASSKRQAALFLANWLKESKTVAENS